MNHRPLLLVLGLMLTATGGCLSTGVGDPEAGVIDPKLAGIWYGADDNDEELWFVEPLDKRSYLVQWVRFETKDDKPTTAAEPLTFHAWLTDLGGRRFVSLKWFAPGTAVPRPNGEVAARYVVARLTPADNGLTVRPVDAKFDPARRATTPAELEQVIARHAADAGLFAADRTLVRIDPDHPGAAGLLIELMTKPGNQ